MPTATYIPLATYTVPGGGDAEVLFSNIPTSGYRDLILMINGGHNTTSTISIEVQPNSDSANGSIVYMYGYSGGPVSSTATRIFCTLSGSDSTVFMHVMDYAQTDKHKSFLIRSGAIDEVWAIAGRWASTTAMSSLKLLDTGGQTFDAGTTFSLYGIAG